MEAIDYMYPSDTSTLNIDLSRLSQATKLFSEYHRHISGLDEGSRESDATSFFVNNQDVKDFIKKNNYTALNVANLIRSSATRSKTHSRHIYDARKLLSENRVGFGSALYSLT